MDSLDVGSQISFMCKAFLASCMWAGEGGRRGGWVGGVDVFSEAAFISKAFVTV